MYIQICIPYSRKIWRELNLAKWPKTAKIKYWRNLNLAIAYGEDYDVILKYFWQFILTYYVILGAQRATLLNR